MLELVGRYRILEQIGEGAMADVYRAYDPHIDRPLVVKVLKAEYRQDREYSIRFLREARAAGALSHPGIVTIFDVGEIDGYPFIVMEYLDGEPLSEVMKAGSLPPADVISIGMQLAAALGYAHAQGVVHRDVKPSNVIVSPDRKTVKLLDFGIARVAEGDLFEQEALKTQIGQVVGTPRYMSPEQALGRDLDGRSDIFSLGVVLYELASGRRAFPAANAATLAAQIAQADPEPMAKVAPDVPRGLQFIIGKAMSRDPAQRFADGYRMSEALRRELSVSRTVAQEAAARHDYVSFAVKLAALLTLITAAVLAASVLTAVVAQRRAMRDVALASGQAISSFVANNAALRAVDNAALPPEAQDWLPVEVFVRSASADRGIRGITVVDAAGIVRAASQETRVGQPYRAPLNEEQVSRRGDIAVTEVEGGDAFRFVRPITYAGRGFGKVDVAVDATALHAASRTSELALLLVSIVTLLSVGAAAYLSGRMLKSPIERLREALLEIARGNLDFRISHHRKDEFGELFEGVNMVAQSMEERLSSVEAMLLDVPAPPPVRTEEAPKPETVTLQQVEGARAPIPPQSADPDDAEAPPTERVRTWAHDEDEDSTVTGDLPDNRF
ncbi:protein kinase domain-containing protein [Sphingomonas jatrophae]|uniref:non-specific serine/threonine protein kinase n=1 Tax=Sphingomonas jatrophae TaxID=1166337 RepID=A0A1I6M215_9SPHN|nr:protein kinase [Sphingomonas jatrophae]SFS09750.1 serine/threonine protein kinase [Sphingomonas jatrophae]